MCIENRFIARSRSAIVLTGITVACFTATLVSAQTASLTGSWQMDSAKSQVSDSRTVSLNIEGTGGKLKISSTVHTKSGNDVSTEFTCTADGKECEFNEGGHKSKVSMWYVGAALNVCKTDGPAGDVVSQWKLEPSSDGKGLTLTVTHLDPTAAEETLVFAKKSS